MESFKPSKKRCRSIQTQGDMETNKASLKLQINARFRGVRQIIDLNQNNQDLREYCSKIGNGNCFAAKSTRCKKTSKNTIWQRFL